MMNLVAICLVLTSLVTGGVWSPSPENPDPNQRDLIVKEGHRVVVVEYEKEGGHGDGNTKVLISPQGSGDDKSGYIHVAEEKLSEAASATKGAVEDAKGKVKDAASGPRELICDAFGKCKHKIASALGKTKEMVSEEARQVPGKVKETEEHAKKAVEVAYEKAKDFVTDKTHEGIEKGREIGGKVKEAVSEELNEKVRDMASKVQNWDPVDSPKRIKEDITQNVSRVSDEAAKQAAGTMEGPARHAGEAVEDVKEKGKKGLNEILGRGRGVVYDFLCYGLPLKRLDLEVDVLQLLGVSAAYGMSIFVSFVSSYVLSRALTKQQFGMVQSKMYPVYFKCMGFAVGVALLGHLLSQRKRVFSDKLVMFQAFELSAALLTVFVRMFYLEPRSTKLMLERMKIDKEEGKARDSNPCGGVAAALGDPVCVLAAEGSVASKGGEAGERREIVEMTARLKRLNLYSSVMNGATMVLLSWHLVYLGHCLQLSR